MAVQQHPLQRYLQTRRRPAGSGARPAIEERHAGLGLALVVLPLTGLALLRAQGAIPGDLAAHGMYIPIVIAAYFFGVRGSVAVSVLAGLAALSAGPAGFAMTLRAWLPLFAVYLTVGGSVGVFLNVLDERRKKVIRSQIDSLKSFAMAVETEDDPGGEHCERVAMNARTVGEALGMKRGQLEDLYWAGLLHDIGKMTIPREILRKPGGLTLEEYLVMRRHARLGANLLSSIDSFKCVAEGVGAHHERWDGSGYPSGIQGDQIPVFGRILAVVDVFEALSSDRPYRKALSREDALEELRRGAGSHFDPELVELYERLYRQGRIQVANHSDTATQRPLLQPQPQLQQSGAS